MDEKMDMEGRIMMIAFVVLAVGLAVGLLVIMGGFEDE